MMLTRAVEALLYQGQGHWLIGVIASYQDNPLIKELDLQIWKLLPKDGTAVLICERDTGEVVVRQIIEDPDFPLREIVFYLSNQTLMLPSEY